VKAKAAGRRLAEAETPLLSPLTAKQTEALSVCKGTAQHIALRGGSRSGKTALLVRNIFARAIKAPGSRHAIFRFRFSHCKQKIGMETIPFVLKAFFPGLLLEHNKSDWYYKFSNASEVWLGGLDDKERTEKVLGGELVTAFLNECSQIPWQAVGLVKTRLAQKVMQEVGGIQREMRPRMYYDYNPPSKAHWTYKIFEKKVDPDSGQPLPNPDNYASFRLNPEDNAENLAAGYLDELKNSSSRYRKRFLEGEYSDDNPYALFSDLTIDKWRELGGGLPEFIRIVVAVDPSGAGDVDNAEQDEIGIIVAALGTNGHAYILEDDTLKAGPATWGGVATGAFDRHAADIVVGERNFGGEMVRFTIQTARPNTPYKHVTASRGKTVRAEPVAALYENGKVHHVGHFRKLEDELLSFSTMGYLGQKSPNRADALVWAIYELFPALTRGEAKPEDSKILSIPGGRYFAGAATAGAWR